VKPIGQPDASTGIPLGVPGHLTTGAGGGGGGATGFVETAISGAALGIIGAVIIGAGGGGITGAGFGKGAGSALAITGRRWREFSFCRPAKT